MRKFFLLASFCLALIAPLAAQPAAAPQHDARLRGAYRFERDGWVYVHLEGTPSQIGYQHGMLLARDIEALIEVFAVEARHDSDKPWSFYRNSGRTILWPHIDGEYRAELEGIADGLHAQYSTLDLWDVVALNGFLELNHYYLPWLNDQKHKKNLPKTVPPGKCSAFIATGSITRGDRIVIAHNNWS